VNLPGVARIDAADGRRDAALGNDRVGLAEQRFADNRDAGSRAGSLDRRT